jgi:copper chaperone
MISFSVSDMTCGHCVNSITKAVTALDQGAQVHIELATHRVDIEPSEVSAADLSAAITEAGYTPIAIDSRASMDITAEAPARKGCCRG